MVRRRSRSILGTFKRAVLLLEVTCLLIAIRLGLRLLPFRTLYRMVMDVKRADARPAARDGSWQRRVAWAVNRAGGTVLADSACLSQALAGLLLLHRRGISAHLRIGVLKRADGTLLAHAWLESEGSILIGGPDVEVARYTALPTLDGVRV